MRFLKFKIKSKVRYTIYRDSDRIERAEEVLATTKADVAQTCANLGDTRPARFRGKIGLLRAWKKRSMLMKAKRSRFVAEPKRPSASLPNQPKVVDRSHL